MMIFSRLRTPSNSFIRGLNCHKIPAIQRSLSTEAQNTSLSGENIDPFHGSYHWIYERTLSVMTLGLVGTALVVEPSRMVDMAISAVLPLHCHIGFSAVITDYLPKRKFPAIYPVAMGLLYAGTAATIYGLYKFNTQDIGISEAMAQIWNSKKVLEDQED